MLRSLENLRDAGLRVSMCRQRSSIRPLSAGGSRAARLPDLRQPDAQGLQCGGHHLQGAGVPRDRLPPPLPLAPPPPPPLTGPASVRALRSPLVVRFLERGGVAATWPGSIPAGRLVD